LPRIAPLSPGDPQCTESSPLYGIMPKSLRKPRFSASC
jgi:hypothetical protein